MWLLGVRVFGLSGHMGVRTVGCVELGWVGFNTDWGSFSIEEANGKDDRSAFLLEHMPTYLLY